MKVSLKKTFITGRLPWQPSGIKCTQCVSGQKSAFSSLQEKLCVGSKNDWHLLELSGRSLSACKVWGRSNHARRLYERKFVFFCMSRLVCLRVGDIVQTSIVWRFMGRFWFGFQLFFHNGLFCQMHYIVLIFVARWRHNFREIAINISKRPKIGGKVCAHHFV